jgi:hypothetical protein
MLVWPISLAGASPAAPHPVRADEGSGSSLKWSAELAGRPVGKITSSAPLTLDDDRPLLIKMSVTNDGKRDVKIRSLRLEGRVMGLVFFRYTIALGLELEPGQNSKRTISLDLDDLAGQAVGLLPSDLRLVDTNREVLAEESFPVEVRGSLWSAYGIFGVAVGAITAILLASLLIAIGRGSLPRNRWTRGLQFATPGVGLGLTLTFSLSATSLIVPGAPTWLPIVAVFAGGAFLLGYFLPLGGLAEDEEDPDTADRVETKP